MVSRAFMTAEVKSDPIVVEALTPDVLGMIGRALIRKGQIVQYIDTSSGSLKLLPCESHDVAGYPDPDTWRYTCTIGGPDRTYTYNRVPSSGVIHLRYAQDPETAWRGIGPSTVGATRRPIVSGNRRQSCRRVEYAARWVHRVAGRW